jgi:hypothetical protein
MSVPAFKLTGYVPIKIKRRGEGTYEQGNWIPASPTFVTISANVQPILAKDGTKILPEGDFSKGAIKLYSREPFYERKEGFDGTGSDVIEWEGEEYEVMKVIKYSMKVLDHYMAVALQVART